MTAILLALNHRQIPAACECRWRWQNPPRGPWQLVAYHKRCPLHGHLVRTT